MPLQCVHCTAILALLGLQSAAARRTDFTDEHILLHKETQAASLLVMDSIGKDRSRPSDDPLMSSIGCGGTFHYPSKNSEAVQDFISQYLAPWVEAAGSDQNISSRPEGAAAAAVLETVSVDLKVLAMMAFEGKLFRWAVFTRDDAGGLVMQAVAFVQQEGDSVTVHGIVSRRSLLNDKAAVSGGGKALIATLLEVVHQEDLERTVSVVGSPGDSFVDELYRKNGMKEVGRTEDDSVKLQMDIPAKCVGFIQNVMLCKKVSFIDYGAILWRLIDRQKLLFDTCAHILPVDLYMENIGKMMGRAK